MKQLKWIVPLVAITLLIGCSGGQPAAPQTDQTAVPDQGNGGAPNQPPGDGTGQPPMGPGGATVEPTAAAAFQDVNRLAVGILFLKTSAQPVTKDQAVALLPYWQEIQTSRQGGQDQDQGQGVDAQAMIDAVANIRGALTADQLALIDGMTEENMAATMEQYGVSMGRGGSGPGGQPQGDPGAMETAQALGTPMPGPGERPQGDPGAMETAQALGTPMPGPGQGGDGTMPPGGGGRQSGGGSQLIEAVIAELQTLASG